MRGRRNDRLVKGAVLAAALVAAAAVAVSVALAAVDSSSPSADPATDAKAARPTVALTANDPLRLRGTRFKAQERVRVTVDDGSGAVRKTATAGATGAFVVTFAGVDSCSLTVTAVGDRGSRTSFQLSSFVCD